MRKKELLIHSHSCRGFSVEEIIPPVGFGAVLAGRGWQTAFLDPLALHAMLQERDILHVSLHTR